MIGAVRSEWQRLKNPHYMLGGIGLMTALGLLVTLVVFLTATGTALAAPPRGRTVSLSALEASDGMFAGLQLGANMWGIVALVVWAIATASDYSSGMVRLLVQAQPNRLRLLGGKVAALTFFTCLATLVTTAVVLAASPAIAGIAGVSTESWWQGAAGTIASGYLHLTLSALMWGFAGLFVGVLTRSAGLSIAVGIGYLLVFEMVLGMALDSAAKWLPGSAFGAVAAGGTRDMGFASALLLGLGYIVLTTAIAGVTFHRRDITA